MKVSVVVLVEGESDRVALEALAIRRGLDLAAVGIVVQPMGGIGNLARFLERAGSGHGVVCGLTTRPRNERSDARWNERVSARTSRAQGSRRWGSSRARRTWRTS